MVKKRRRNAILLSLHSTVVDVRDALLASSHRDELFVDGWSFKVAADFEDEEETKMTLTCGS